MFRSFLRARVDEGRLKIETIQFFMNRIEVDSIWCKHIYKFCARPGNHALRTSIVNVFVPIGKT